MVSGKEGCCRDEKVIIKASDKHKPSSNAISINSPDAVLLEKMVLSPFVTNFKHIEQFITYTYFPPKPPPAFILLCKMLI